MRSFPISATSAAACLLLLAAAARAAEPALPPAAQAHYDKGMAAASGSKEQLDELRAAWDSDHGSPWILYRLGQANMAAGNKAAAALWWRAARMASPADASAPWNREDLARLADQLEAEGREKIRRAVSLAARLPAKPLDGRGGQSPREYALKRILTLTDKDFDLDDVSAALRRHLGGTGGFSLDGRPWRPQHGLVNAALMEDEPRALALRRALGGIGENLEWDAAIAGMYANLGQPEKAEEWLKGYGPDDLVKARGKLMAGLFVTWGDARRADALFARLEKSPLFTLKDSLDEMSWAMQMLENGEPEPARRLAGRALARYRGAAAARKGSDAAALQDAPAGAIAGAELLTGDWEGAEATIFGYDMSWQDRAFFLVSYRAAGDAALLDPQRARPFLERLWEKTRRKTFHDLESTGSSPEIKEKVARMMNPAYTIALELLDGREDQARAELAEWSKPLVREDFKELKERELPMILHLAVAFKRTDLAIAAADAYGDSFDAGLALRRLAAAGDEPARARVSEYLRGLYQGEPPATVSGEARLLNAARLAMDAQDLPESYQVSPPFLRDLAASSPEALPPRLADLGLQEALAASALRAR